MTMSVAKGRPITPSGSASVATHRPDQYQIALDSARTRVRNRMQMHFVTGDSRGRVVFERAEFDTDASILVIDVERERVATNRDVVDEAERVRVVAGSAD